MPTAPPAAQQLTAGRDLAKQELLSEERGVRVP